MQQRWFFGGAFALTALIAVGVMLWRLDVRPVENWDEAIHGQVSRAMVKSGNWVDLQYRGGDYFRKPPLSFWLRSVTMLTLGDTVWSLRLWSALAGLATAGLLGYWAGRLWKNRWLALLTGLVFVTGRFVFFHAFRTGESDGLLAFFVTLALYAYWRSWSAPRWLLVTGAATGLAVMTKSAGGLLPVLIIGAHLLITWRWPFRWKLIFGALGLFLAITLPWHLMEWARHGAQFWRDYAGLHIIERVTDELHNQGVGLLWYKKIFVQRFFPWSLWVPLAAVWAAVRWWRDRRGIEGLLLVWLFVTFIFFTVAQTKFDWYLLPLYPAAALLVAPWLVTLVKRPAWPTSVAHAVSFSAALWLLPSALHPDTALRWLYPLTTRVGESPTLMYALLSAAAVIVFLLCLSRRRPHWLSPVIGAYAGAKLLLLAVGFSLLTIRAESPATSPLPITMDTVRQEAPARLFVQGVDLYRYPAAEWYFRSLPNVTVVDLTRETTPVHFTAGDILIERTTDRELRPGFILIGQIEDFRVLKPQIEGT